jgi:hypothetical protein
MITFLTSLLSWLCGFSAILAAAFFSYDYFSIIDITSFGSLSFMAIAVTVPLFYLPLIWWMKKRISISRQFIYFPAGLALFANPPLYFVTWINTPVNCGVTEAMLFTTGFIVTALVFGLVMAYRQRRLSNSNR